ncbi:MAG: 1-deoxy-D-xylulose-5-phosphate synthase [Anaerovoracaceae bacterium]
MIKNILEYNFPEDLRNMSDDELEFLTIQIREFLLEKVSKTGGHIASNLGAVELTIALHYLFDTPKDKIIWDVGHQTYVHKILTGRANEFDTLRQFKGLSGFPKTSESPYDTFDTGHSSNSISLAASFAKARDLNNENYEIVSVIGDGALTGGISYEGLNNLGGMRLKSIIILNDNGMSIGKNTGGVSRHLGKVRVSKGYYSFKKNSRKVLTQIPGIGDAIYNGAAKLKDLVKFTVVDGIMFEELGFTYLGPIDGHNLKDLIFNLKLAKAADGPVIMHIITKKGKGYRIAEQNPSKFHGLGPFDVNTGNLLNTSKEKTFSSIFGDKIVEIAQKNDKIVAVSAAMIDGTGLRNFADKYHSRMFDVGIAEGHAVTFAAGLAQNGYKPFVAIYSTFLQRAYDQILIDVCLQNLPVIFAIDRAGVVGADGETHHGLFDISYLKHMPNLVVLAPRDGKELEEMMDYAVELNCPVAIRYPRGAATNLKLPLDKMTQEWSVFSKGTEVTIIAAGNMFPIGEQVCSLLKEKNLSTGLINPRTIHPVDIKSLIEVAKHTKNIITIEDGCLVGGFGESVNSILKNTDVKVYNFAWPNQFIEQGSTDQLRKEYNLDAESIFERICELIER